MAQAEATSFRAGAIRFSEQWPYLRYLGMGAWWAWIWLSFNSMSLFELWSAAPLSGYVGLLYLYSTPAIALMCIVAAAMWVRSTRMLRVRPLVLAFGAVATLGSALVAFSPWIGGDAGFAMGGVLTGIGTSAICLKSGEVFGTLGRREVLTAGYMALMFAAFLFFMGIGLPPSWRPLFTAALPLASAFLYIMPGDDPFPADESGHLHGHSGPGLREFVGIAIAAVMVAATAGFARGVAAAEGAPDQFAFVSPAVTFAIFVGALVICFLVNCGSAVRMIRASYAFLIFFGVAVAILSIFGVDLGFLAIGKELLWMLFTCLMAYMVFRFDFSPVRAFGLGQAAYLVASAVAWWLGMAVAGQFEAETMRLAAPAIMVLAIVVVYVFVFSDSDLRFILTWRVGAEPEGAGSGDAHRQDGTRGQEGEHGQEAVHGQGNAHEAERAEREGAGEDDAHPYVAPHDLALSERIALIDERFGISSREVEVMELFAQGRSANWIAEELVISKNTVRSHLRSIYTKLDVHTRQELLDFLKTVS